MKPKTIRKHLKQIIGDLSADPMLYLRDPMRDFTRTRKLSFSDTVSVVLQMEGKSTANEILNFYRSANAPSASALRQQRNKILPDAFEFIFRRFSEACMDRSFEFHGHRLLAVDGSDLLTATGPSDPESFFREGRKSYNIFHLNALYDIGQKIYTDAIVQRSRRANEHRALCDMVDRSDIEKAVIIADRGFESYNVLAHIQKKGWKFLIRVKAGDSGIASGLDLPDCDEFDLPIKLRLSNKLSNEMKELYKDRNHFRHIPSTSTFDFLPSKSRKCDPPHFFDLCFRVVRFKISDSAFETVVTDLPYPPDELKALYAMRWGIETSFRSLKYTVGLSSFHSKKADHILQEIFARLTMYNFASAVTHSVTVRHKQRKHPYQINFSAAVHICRQFFRGDIRPPDVEALIATSILPVRQGRASPRVPTSKSVVSFNYRIA